MEKTILFKQKPLSPLSLTSDLSHMCCLARRGPEPRHRRLHSSPHTWTQSAKRSNILSGSPHSTEASFLIYFFKCPKYITVTFLQLVLDSPRSRRVQQCSTCTQDVPPRTRARWSQSTTHKYALYQRLHGRTLILLITELHLHPQQQRSNGPNRRWDSAHGDAPHTGGSETSVRTRWGELEPPLVPSAGKSSLFPIKTLMACMN